MVMEIMNNTISALRAGNTFLMEADDTLDKVKIAKAQDDLLDIVQSFVDSVENVNVTEMLQKLNIKKSED